MNLPMIQAVLVLSLCPLLVAQQPSQAAALSTAAKHAPAEQKAADAPQPSAITDHNQILKSARMIYVSSNTDFLTVSTMDRALLQQKNWEKLGLNIVESLRRADLQALPDRSVDLHPYPHLHPYGSENGHRSRLGQSNGLRRNRCLRSHGRANCEDTFSCPAPGAGGGSRSRVVEQSELRRIKERNRHDPKDAPIRSLRLPFAAARRATGCAIDRIIVCIASKGNPARPGATGNCFVLDRKEGPDDPHGGR